MVMAPEPLDPALRTQRRIALIVSAAVVIFAWMPGPASTLGSVSLEQRLGIALAYLLHAILLSTFEPWRRRAATIFEGLLYATGLWAVWAVQAEHLSTASVLTLVMVTFGLGLCFRDAERLARFYLTILAGLATVYIAIGAPALTDPTMVLAVLGVIMIVAYITARARDLAQEETRRLAVVASHVHNGVLTIDARGRVTWINEGFTRMTGRRWDDAVGFPLGGTYASPPSAPSALRRLEEALHGGVPLTVELARIRPDGTVLWVALDLSPILDPDGRVASFVAIETDVSAAHRYVSQIQEAMSDWLFVLGAGGTVESANRAACTGLERAPEELVGAALADFVTPLPRSLEESSPDLQAHAAAVEQLLDAVRSGVVSAPRSGVELGLRTRSGAVVPVNVSLSALTDDRDASVRLVLVARDIRERQRMEREQLALERKVRQAQKLESLGVLAGGIAHDFNNLLVGMLGNASLLREKVEDTPDLRGLVERIEESATRAADLTRQMLAYSGRGRFVIEPMDISGVAEEMRRLVAAAISKRATVRLELARELPAVEGDATQVRQVIMNLLTNASDALGGGDGTIIVRTGLVDADASTLSGGVLDDDLPPGRYVMLEVEDDGVGMTEPVRRRMFDPFFTTKSTGRGLGLAATLGIVRGHRGAIRVRSAPGHGTVVTVLLPASDRAPARAPTPLGPAPVRGSQGVVLVADDEPAVLDFVTDVLRTTGAEVIRASDGVECVERFKERRGDITLVILDLTMPRLNGDETLRALRELRPDVPVLLSSGYTEQEATARFRGEGLAGFLQKPYRARQLLAQVRPLLGVHAARPGEVGA